MGYESNLSACFLCVCDSNEGNTCQNVIQAYLCGILAHKGRSAAILSDNGKEFKNAVLNEVCGQLGIKRLYSNLFHPQGNAKEVGNVHNVLKWTLIKWLERIDLEWDELLPFACYCYNIFPSSNST